MTCAPWHTSGEVEGAEDPAPDLPARQIAGAQSGREGLAISSGEQADGLAAGCDAWTRLMKEPRAIKSGASRDRTQNSKPEDR